MSIKEKRDCRLHNKNKNTLNIKKVKRVQKIINSNSKELRNFIIYELNRTFLIKF